MTGANDPGGPFGYRLRGADAEHALAWMHVHADVRGVLEEPDALVVWLAGPLPPLPPLGDLAVEARPARPDDATRTGREHDAPILVADDLLVRPPWVARPAGFAGVELVVPRGGAFGSGEHGSTQAALRCLHRAWPEEPPASFADVGTGSGILALYAHVRGARRIAACDVDAAAVAAARELLPAADVREGGPETLPPGDLVVANLTAAELRGCLAAVLGAWTRRDALVLGGLRSDEVAPLVAAVPAVERLRETVGEFTAVAFGPDPARPGPVQRP